MTCWQQQCIAYIRHKRWQRILVASAKNDQHAHHKYFCEKVAKGIWCKSDQRNSVCSRKRISWTIRGENLLDGDLQVSRIPPFWPDSFFLARFRCHSINPVTQVSRLWPPLHKINVLFLFLLQTVAQLGTSLACLGANNVEPTCPECPC